MSSRPHILHITCTEPESANCNTNGNTSDARRAPNLTRVQIEALVSGDFAPIRLGPELVHRLNHTWSAAGQHLHMLHVEVVHTPVRCPRCGDSALYRKERRGFFQRRMLPFLGLYPWNCISCRKTTLLRLRSADHVPGTLPAGPQREFAGREAA